MSEFFKTSGRKIEVKAASPGEWTLTRRPGGWLIAERQLSDGARERRRFMIRQVRGRFGAAVGGQLYQGEWISGAEHSGAAGGSDSDLIAQFPGKVRKLLVREGDQVEESAPLLMVEAMKMEFPVKAPFAGRVTRIRVAEGQQLSPGDRFLDLEPEGGS